MVFKGDGLPLTFVDYLSGFKAPDTLPPGTWFTPGPPWWWEGMSGLFCSVEVAPCGLQ